MLFKNREEAANLLAEKLEKYKSQNPVVLAVPRGAVVMGKIIAEKLNADLDVVLVKKVGAPENPEFAIGSATESGDVHPNLSAMVGGISKQDLELAAKEVVKTLKERRNLYSPFRLPLNLKDKTVIIVDDGIATGLTIFAALKSIRKKNPKNLVVATPVAPPHTVQRLKSLCDQLIVLATPMDFFAIGEFYSEFPQVSDTKVCEILQAAHKAPADLPVSP